jgi:glycosyltransferase involved in cell wall biosynthesis
MTPATSLRKARESAAARPARKPALALRPERRHPAVANPAHDEPPAGLPVREVPRKLRIVWYRTGEMLQFGGGERVLLEGLRCLTELGAEVRLLLHEPPASPTGAFFARHHAHVDVLPGFSLAGDGGSAATRFARRVRSLARTFRTLAPDVVIAESPVEARFLWVYSLGGRLRLPPVVTFIHGSPFQFADDTTKYARVFRRQFAAIRDEDPVYRETIPRDAPPMGRAARLRLELECAAVRAAIRMSARVFVLSEKNRAEVRRLYGVADANALVVSPGGFARDAVKTADAATLPDLGAVTRPLILSVCRLIAKKRVDILLRAFRLYADGHPASNATLVVCGTGPEGPALRALAASLGLGQRVRFIGFIPDADLAGWYRAADLFVNADNADYDLTVMAALPAGRKIVISTQYDLPAGLSALRRFFFVAQPSADGYAQAIATALAASVAPPAAADRGELRKLTWESYFARVLDQVRRIAAEASPYARNAP